MKVTIITTPFDGIIAGLLAKKYDAIIASMTITPERLKAVDFAGPYYHAGRTIVVKDDSPIHSLDQLKDVTVGVTLGDAHDKWARARGNLKVKTYKGLPEMLVDLEAGRIDAIVMDSVPVLVAVKETGQKVRIITPRTAMAASKAWASRCARTTPSSRRRCRRRWTTCSPTAATKRSRCSGSARTFADALVTWLDPASSPST